MTDLPHTPPFQRSLVQRLAARLLGLAGWRLVYRTPPAAKGVIVVYPHTSNWDFIVGMLYKLGIGLPVRWMGKDTLFRWPLGPLLRRLGGIAVNRREHTGFVETMLAEFARREWMWLVIAPEGTVVNPHYPATVGSSQITVGTQIVEACALSLGLQAPLLLGQGRRGARRIDPVRERVGTLDLVVQRRHLGL